ncbi:hypothetical protein MA16_Dca021841 [Dendrobium catenatum]|uniref:Uncharacterized protein n=1 Tax=Dendrobium catenatum TaxID=906689 RepID=A0A2I0X689_9ASPA|nr:hypothetical protein MA16_Dca021841 [Dendrobium catenatum]
MGLQNLRTLFQVKKERRFEGIETNREIAALFCLEELKLRNPNEMEMKIVKEFN